MKRIGQPIPTDPHRAQFVPASVKRFWTLTDDMLQGLPEAQKTKVLQQYKAALPLVGEIQRKGIGILAGTDSPGMSGVVPGFSLHDELALMVDAGLTPLQALQTATLNPARFLGRLDDLGTVGPGKLADLVLLEANPLEDIRNAVRIDAVIVQGRLLDRASLDLLLREAREAVRNH